MDKTNFLLNTDDNIQKMYKDETRRITVPADFSYHEYLVPHNLNYVPIVKAWYTALPGKWFPVSLVQMIGQNQTLSSVGYVEIDDTDVHVYFANFSSSNATIDFIVRIYLNDNL